MIEEACIFPASFGQQQLWFLHQLEPNSTAYNFPCVARLAGALDVCALEQSLNEIIRRHAVLRTTFALEAGEPVQVIAAELTLALTIKDLTDAVDQEHELQQQIAAEANLPFDLQHGPLLRATLLCLSETEHALVLTMHHIVCDGWSMSVLLRELSALYRAYWEGRESPLPELPVQYVDYAVWQREWLQGEVLAQQLKYWREQLAGIGMLELPTDRVRPAVQSYRGARQRVSLTSRLTSELKKLSQRTGVSLNMTLLAAFTALLSRYSGQEEIVVGTPSANRTQAEVEGLIGFFVNTLVLRMKLGGNPTFSELMKRVKDVCIGAYSHPDLPFEKLVEELEPDRSLSHNPLFQIVFTHIVPATKDLNLPGLTTSLNEGLNYGTSKFDLNLTAIPHDDAVTLIWEYNTDLFDATTIARLAKHYERLLQAVVANSEQRVSQLTLLSESEQRQLLYGFNDTERNYSKPVCLHELFEAQVEQTPDAIAVVFENEKLTYAELNERANQLAHYLRELGVGPEVVVGVCLERSVEMVVALDGILKAGGAYLPLEPSYPTERLTFMLRDAKTSVLLTTRALAERFANHGLSVVCLDGARFERPGGEIIKNQKSGVTSANPAYVIYTSGSTGQPKGVMVPHSGICNRLQWMQEAYGLTAADHVLQKTPFSFDVSVWEFFWPLITGARLVVAQPGGHRDNGYLIELIERERITTLHFVPSMLQAFLEELGTRNCGSLKRVICSGEALPVETQERFFKHQSAELHNLYGPTEASVDVTYWACERNSDARTVPIGYPIANTQIHLLDGELQPVPVGVTGELYIGGVGLARGYVNRPELTATRFVPHPFATAPGARLYRTGDLARYRADGSIEFLGRIDHQIKLRGHRIELGEIEAALAAHDEVSEVVVLARGEENGEQRLVAYVVREPDSDVTSRRLREYLKERLPEYMVPSAYMMLKQLPLTSNGKVDRKALPAPELSRAESRVDYIAPRTPIERLLAEVWVELLGVERIGVHDNFFNLGGHSILGTMMISSVRKKTDVDLPVRSIFELPTIAKLSELIQQLKASRIEPEPPIVAVSRVPQRAIL